MGTEAAWVPLVLTAVSAAGQVYNTQRTAKKKDNALAAQINASAEKNREGNKRVTQMADDLGKSTAATEKNKAMEQFVQALQSAGGTAASGLTGTRANVSRYDEAGQAAALGLQKYGMNMADNQSSVIAPIRQREEEGFSRIRAGNDLADLERKARAQDFINGLKVDGIHRNPWIDAGSAMLGGAASSYAAGMGSGAPTSLFAVDPNASLATASNGSSNLFRGLRNA